MSGAIRSTDGRERCMASARLRRHIDACPVCVSARCRAEGHIYIPSLASAMANRMTEFSMDEVDSARLGRRM